MIVSARLARGRHRRKPNKALGRRLGSLGLAPFEEGIPSGLLRRLLALVDVGELIEEQLDRLAAPQSMGDCQREDSSGRTGDHTPCDRSVQTFGDETTGGSGRYRRPLRRPRHGWLEEQPMAWPATD